MLTYFYQILISSNPQKDYNGFVYDYGAYWWCKQIAGLKLHDFACYVLNVVISYPKSAPQRDKNSSVTPFCPPQPPLRKKKERNQ